MQILLRIMIYKNFKFYNLVNSNYLSIKIRKKIAKKYIFFKIFITNL